MEQTNKTMGFIPLTITLNDYIATGGTGVLGLEYASGYWGISTFPSDYLVVLVPESDIRINALVGFFGIPIKEDFSHTVKISDSLFITDKERTICDMIDYGCELRFLLESIQVYYEDNEDVTKLEDLLKERGLTDKFDKFKLEAEEMYYDDK